MTAPNQPPLTSDQLLKQLKDAGIEVTTTRHKPLLTVEDSKSVRGNYEQGGHCKNLFLRNKKGKMWLVTCHEDRQVDLKSLGQRLVASQLSQDTSTGNTLSSASANRLSFASADRLMTYLGVIPGAVSPFGLANDVSGAVTFFIDKTLLTYESLYFHPLDNSLTTQIRTSDLTRYLEIIHHPINVVDFDFAADGV